MPVLLRLCCNIPFTISPAPLSTGADNIRALSLNYDQNRISITTGTIDFYSLGTSLIRYKTEGINSNWQYASAGYTIRYEKLPPGNYTLLVQASNAAQEWNGPEKRLTILINPPFWQTWWFRTLSGIGLLLLLYGIYQWRTAALRKQKTILEQTVTERTSEVVSQKKEIENQRDQVINAMSELQSAQKQLIHQEKMASLGELTAGIAHEIQNPLNFVNNFSDVSTELIDEMNTEIDNGNLNDAKLLAQDLKQNLEKINHHGNRAGEIVKGMLQHSRSSTGIKEPTDINALCDEYLRLSYHGLRAKDKSFNATMKTDFDNSIGKINITPQDIGRVILNLINNAFYAVNEKKQLNIDEYEPTISVSTKKMNNKIDIRVSDNGNGIPQKILDKIFQPFFYNQTNRTGNRPGVEFEL